MKDFNKIVYANWTPWEQSTLVEYARNVELSRLEPDFAELWQACVSIGLERYWDLVTTKELAE